MIYHTYPEAYLSQTRGLLYIEALPCLTSSIYKSFFVKRAPNTDSILDCGVGLSPNLDKPSAHMPNSPHWGAYYLDLVVSLNPGIVVVPDVLGSGTDTYKFFRLYANLIYRVVRDSWRTVPKFMYVIQGMSVLEAKEQVDLVSERCFGASWVGFPRVVQYYGACSDGEILGEKRIELVKRFLPQLRKAGLQVHLLGMNSLEELRFAAENELSVDTRWASMAALAGLNVISPRPDNININLNQTTLTLYHCEKIRDNVATLNSLFSKWLLKKNL